MVFLLCGLFFFFKDCFYFATAQRNILSELPPYLKAGKKANLGLCTQKAKFKIVKQ